MTCSLLAYPEDLWTLPGTPQLQGQPPFSTFCFPVCKGGGVGAMPEKARGGTQPGNPGPGRKLGCPGWLGAATVQRAPRGLAQTVCGGYGLVSE